MRELYETHLMIVKIKGTRKELRMSGGRVCQRIWRQWYVTVPNARTLG